MTLPLDHPHLFGGFSLVDRFLVSRISTQGSLPGRPLQH